MNKRSFPQSITAAVLTAAAAFAMMGSVAGCTVHDDDEPIVVNDTGTLVLSWELHEGSDPSVCDQSSAPTFEVTVTNSSGIVTTFQQDCRSLATTITLAPGAYTATAELLAANGAARTTSIVVNPFEIHQAVQLNITIDFPANSFE